MADEPLKDRFSSDESFDDEEESESDSDVDARLAEDDVFDAEFLKCYSALKKKDQKIYDKNVRFFDNEASSSDEAEEPKEGTEITSNISKARAPKMTLLDLQLRTEGDVDEEAIDNPKIDLSKEVSKSFYEKELEEIKKSIEEVGGDMDDSDDELLKVKDPTTSDSSRKRKGKISALLDKLVDEDGEDINHLKQVWCDPDNLSKEDKYLRDYILNKRYLPTNANVDDDEPGEGFFSKNLEDLSEVESDDEVGTKSTAPTRHSDEPEFDKIARIPRNSTKTIRDMVEKREKREKRAKKLEKEKKKKKGIANADCEDVIGDLPTRFHYRQTEANDFGLTAEELLMATDEELDQWVNLKECIAYKSIDEELEQKRKFDALRNNMELKRKIFKSVYNDEQQDDLDPDLSKPSKKKRNHKRKHSDNNEELDNSSNTGDTQDVTPSASELKSDKKKKKRRRGLNHKKFAKVGVSPDRLLAYGISKTKLKKRKLL